MYVVSEQDQAYPEFTDLIYQFDIICLQETKVDDIDSSAIVLNDFNIMFTKSKKYVKI